jgi:hypothetical protein
VTGASVRRALQKQVTGAAVPPPGRSPSGSLSTYSPPLRGVGEAQEPELLAARFRTRHRPHLLEHPGGDRVVLGLAEEAWTRTSTSSASGVGVEGRRVVRAEYRVRSSLRLSRSHPLLRSYESGLARDAGSRERANVQDNTGDSTIHGFRTSRTCLTHDFSQDRMARRIRMRPAGIEPATSRSGGARSIP